MYSASDLRRRQNKVAQVIVTVIVLVAVTGYLIYVSGVNQAVKYLRREFFPESIDYELAKEHYKAAVDLLDTQFVETVAAQFDMAIDADPGFTDAWFQRGMLMMQFNPAQAIADFTSVIDLRGADPAYADAYFFRAAVYLDQGELEAAAADYTRYINAPDAERIPNPVLESYRRRSGDPSLFSSRKWQAYVARGESYFLARKTEEALNDFYQALSMDHDNTLRLLKNLAPRFRARLEVLPAGEARTKLGYLIEQIGD